MKINSRKITKLKKKLVKDTKIFQEIHIKFLGNVSGKSVKFQN